MKLKFNKNNTVSLIGINRELLSVFMEQVISGIQYDIGRLSGDPGSQESIKELKSIQQTAEQIEETLDIEDNGPGTVIEL